MNAKQIEKLLKTMSKKDLIQLSKYFSVPITRQIGGYYNKNQMLQNLMYRQMGGADLGSESDPEPKSASDHLELSKNIFDVYIKFNISNRRPGGTEVNYELLEKLFNIALPDRPVPRGMVPTPDRGPPITAQDFKDLNGNIDAGHWGLCKLELPEIVKKRIKYKELNKTPPPLSELHKYLQKKNKDSKSASESILPSQKKSRGRRISNKTLDVQLLLNGITLDIDKKKTSTTQGPEKFLDIISRINLGRYLKGRKLIPILVHKEEHKLPNFKINKNPFFSKTNLIEFEISTRYIEDFQNAAFKNQVGITHNTKVQSDDRKITEWIDEAWNDSSVFVKIGDRGYHRFMYRIDLTVDGTNLLSIAFNTQEDMLEFLTYVNYVNWGYTDHAE